MKMSYTAIATLLAWACVLQTMAADGAPSLPPPSSKKNVAFTQDILPIFQKSCVGCHGPEKAKGKIRLDSLESVIKGGEHGKIIQAGNSARSKLVLAVAGETDEPMPPKGKGDPLTPEQIGLIRAWIDQGAK